jgi:hypothetical protein
LNINSIEQHGEVTVVRATYESSEDGLRLLLRSDAHHDSVNNLRDLEKKHLEQAVRDDAFILDAGDLFDGMQGRMDPRRGYQDLRPEFKVANYFDAIEDDAYEFYKPYAGRWLMMGKGNHELSVLKNTQIDLTSRLAGRLHVNCGGVGGWVKFKLERDCGGGRTTVNLRYHHGAGGNAPVTKGIIDTARQAVYLPDADLVWNGHNHQAYIMPQSRERITDTNRIYRDTAYYLRTPGYKDQGDWEREKMFPPTPHGAIWVTIHVVRGTKTEIEARTAFE